MQREAGGGKESRRSLTELVRDLGGEVASLLQQEVELTRAEYAEKKNVMTRGARSMAIGGVVIYAGVLALLAALCVGTAQLLRLIPGIDLAVAAWLGPLIVGTVLALIGWGVVAWGRSLMRKQSLMPARTVHTLKEDKRWIEGRLP